MRPTDWPPDIRSKWTNNSRNSRQLALERMICGQPPPAVLAARRLLPNPSEIKLMRFHIDLAPAEVDPLGLQPQPLLGRRIAAQLDLSPRAQHPLPGQFESTMQHLHHLPRRSRKACDMRDRPVSGNVTLWNSPDRRLDPHPHLRRPI